MAEDTFLQPLRAELECLERDGRLRRRRVTESAQGPRIVLDGHEYLSFASNDYLGLAAHPEIAAAAAQAAQQFGVGAGASHLLTGHHALHAELETRFAQHVGAAEALLFSTGYLANLGVITSLLGRHDAVFADRLNHASLVDAARLSGAEHQRYKHNDLADLDQKLEQSSATTKLIATDLVFSMDGDRAPLEALLALAERHAAWLYLDDAHGFGVLEHAVLRPLPARVIYLATLGKAVGVAGALVAAAGPVIEFLVNKARPWIYTTAQPPLLAAAALQSLQLIMTGDDRRAHLTALIALLRQRLAGLPWPVLVSDTPIQPLLIGDHVRAVALAEQLAARGIWLPAIRPPTVPEGTARLRISLSAAHSFEDVETLATALEALA